MTAVERCVRGENKIELLKQVSLSASDAAVESDDSNEVPNNPELTRAIHTANAASSIADAARSSCEPIGQRTLGPKAVAAAVGYAANFSISASEDRIKERDWQLSALMTA